MSGITPNSGNGRGVASYDFSPGVYTPIGHRKPNALDLAGITAGPYIHEDFTERPPRNYVRGSQPSNYVTEHLHRSLISVGMMETGTPTNADGNSRRDSWERDDVDDEEAAGAGGSREESYDHDGHDGHDGHNDDDLPFHEISFGDSQPRMSAEVPRTIHPDHARDINMTEPHMEPSSNANGTDLSMGSDGGGNGLGNRPANPESVDVEAQKPKKSTQDRLILLVCVAVWLFIPVIATFGMFGLLTSHVSSNHANNDSA